MGFNHDFVGDAFSNCDHNTLFWMETNQDSRFYHVLLLFLLLGTSNFEMALRKVDKNGNASLFVLLLHESLGQQWLVEYVIWG